MGWVQSKGRQIGGRACGVHGSFPQAGPGIAGGCQGSGCFCLVFVRVALIRKLRGVIRRDRGQVVDRIVAMNGTHSLPETWVVDETIPGLADSAGADEGAGVVDEAEDVDGDLWGKVAEKIALEEGGDGGVDEEELGGGAVSEKGGEVAETQDRREDGEFCARQIGGVEGDGEGGGAGTGRGGGRRGRDDGDVEGRVEWRGRHGGRWQRERAAGRCPHSSATGAHMTKYV